MRKFAVILLCTVMSFAFVLSNPVGVSAKCDTYDVCTEGIHVHLFKVPLVFEVATSTDERSMPWKDSYNGMHSEPVRHLDAGSSVEVTGLLRNHHDHIWMYTANGGYVYLDNLMFDFNANAVLYYEMMISGTDKQLDFLKLFLPEADADLKQILDPSSKGIQYKVLFSSECSTMTAESMGNMMYGFLGKAAEFDDSDLLIAGGVLNFVERNPNLIDHPEWCLDSYCDSPEDIASVQAGIDYYKSFLAE